MSKTLDIQFATMDPSWDRFADLTAHFTETATCETAENDLTRLLELLADPDHFLLTMPAKLATGGTIVFGMHVDMSDDLISFLERTRPLRADECVAQLTGGDPPAKLSADLVDGRGGSTVVPLFKQGD